MREKAHVPESACLKVPDFMISQDSSAKPMYVVGTVVELGRKSWNLVECPAREKCLAEERIAPSRSVNGCALAGAFGGA